MGVRLDRIPSVRSFYGFAPYETSPIDFNDVQPLPPRNHTMAVRITA